MYRMEVLKFNGGLRAFETHLTFIYIYIYMKRTYNCSIALHIKYSMKKEGRNCCLLFFHEFQAVAARVFGL